MDINQLAKDRLVALGYGEELDDGLLSYLVSKVKCDILNFANLEKIPDELGYVWVDMVAGEYLRATLLSEDSPGSAAAAVSSITEGDTKVDFATSRWVSEALVSKLTSTAPLVAYRRLRW
jgi:hypothetical protein